MIYSKRYRKPTCQDIFFVIAPSEETGTDSRPENTNNLPKYIYNLNTLTVYDLERFVNTVYNTVTVKEPSKNSVILITSELHA